MRFLLSILLLTAVVSCGKNGGSGSGSGAGSDPELQQCEVNGETVSCDSIYDGLGVDILDASIDVPATISSTAITFTQSRSVNSQGRRINCSLSVNSGDVYRYTVNGDELLLDTPNGNIEMKRVYGSGVVGKWRWRGIVDGATFQTRILTVTKNMNRVFMKTTCER